MKNKGVERSVEMNPLDYQLASKEQLDALVTFKLDTLCEAYEKFRKVWKNEHKCSCGTLRCEHIEKAMKGAFENERKEVLKLSLLLILKSWGRPDVEGFEKFLGQE